MNFEILKYIVEYTKSKETDKEVDFSVVSNLMLLDEEKFEFLTEHQVSICTSLDGDEALHNQNRPYFKQNTFEILAKKLAGESEKRSRCFGNSDNNKIFA